MSTDPSPDPLGPVHHLLVKLEADPYASFTFKAAIKAARKALESPSRAETPYFLALELENLQSAVRQADAATKEIVAIVKGGGQKPKPKSARPQAPAAPTGDKPSAVATRPGQGPAGQAGKG